MADQEDKQPLIKQQEMQQVDENAAAQWNEVPERRDDQIAPPLIPLVNDLIEAIGLAVAQRQNNLPGRGDDQIGDVNKERWEQVRHLQKEAFELTNYYFVFQGVILTSAYSIPSHVGYCCRWVPFVLSLLAGILNLGALYRIMSAYMNTLDDIDSQAMLDHIAPPDADALKEARSGRLLACGYMLIVITFLVFTLVGCYCITCGEYNTKAAALPLIATA